MTPFFPKFFCVGFVQQVQKCLIVLQAICFADRSTPVTFIALPQLTAIKAWNGFSQLTPAYIGTIAVAYIPVAFVVFAEHIADHKNLSTIIDKDLLTDPGLSRTLLGDGVGSFVGAVFGGCPNTTYGESIESCSSGMLPLPWGW